MYIIGHRGARGYETENSIASIIKAMELKADYIELDIQTTKDGQIVLMHNPLTPNGLVVRNRTYKTITRELPELITLQVALRAANNNRLILDSKTDGTIAKARRIIAKNNNITIASFKADEILSSRINLPNHKTFLLKTIPLGSISKSKMVDASGVGYNWAWFSLMPYYYWFASKNGLDIYIYTLNVVFIAKIMAKIFPKLLIVTDYPDKLSIIKS